MRYMGDAAPPGLFQNGLTPEAKKQLLAVAAQMTPTQGQDLCDLCDATSAGHSQRLVRFGLGAAAGVLAGYLLCKVLG
jgi:hypothetical protein